MLRDAQLVADDSVESPPSGQGAPVRLAVRGGVGEIAGAGEDAAKRQIQIFERTAVEVIAIEGREAETRRKIFGDFRDIVARVGIREAAHDEPLIGNATVEADFVTRGALAADLRKIASAAGRVVGLGDVVLENIKLRNEPGDPST